MRANACLLATQITTALLISSVGEWHKKLWAAQPNIGSALYHTWSPTADGLRTELREGEEQSELYCIKDDVWQWHFDGGIAAAFLGKLCVPPPSPHARGGWCPAPERKRTLRAGIWRRAMRSGWSLHRPTSTSRWRAPIRSGRPTSCARPAGAP